MPDAATVRDGDAATLRTLLHQAATDHNLINRAILTNLWWEDKVRYELAIGNAETLMRDALMVAETARRGLEQLEQAEQWDRPFPELAA